jgi:Predicted nucleotide-binding protein containing TIR-like domain
VMHGHGIFELFIAKRFTRRGLIIITSNMLDAFSRKPTSREFMMYVGRQLGHIKAGHYRWWYFKDVVGFTSLFFQTAWKRRCHFTADRIGLLAAGNLYSAEQALFIMASGTGVAAGTNYDPVIEQKAALFESVWSWIQLAFSSRPYLIDRIVRLREFGTSIGLKADQIQVLPISHTSLRTIPILIIHGHDKIALLELKDLLYSKFPQIAPRVMLTENVGLLSLPEKFEDVATDVLGAIALVTPDDVGGPRANEVAATVRARQNVVIEIGWVWGKLGRQKCMLLVRGDIELPSDLSGVDVQMFEKSPRECIAELYAFINSISAVPSYDD